MIADFSQVDPAYQHIFDKALAGCDYPFPEDFRIAYKTREGTGGRATDPVEIGVDMSEEQIERAILHETFHVVCYQTYTFFHKRVFANLLHGMNHCPHPWTLDNFTDWTAQVDEAVCELHILAFSRAKYLTNMKHRITKRRARQLRALYTPSKAAWLA